MTRHRLPPRAKCADGTPAGPVPEPARKSWIYGAATEVRSELQAVKEDAEAWSVHQDPGQPQREGIVTLTDPAVRVSIAASVARRCTTRRMEVWGI